MPLDSEAIELLAQRYAPILYHAPDEPNLPTNVDWFLARTSLGFYDDGCTPDLKLQIRDSPTQVDLIGQVHGPSCGSTDTVYSNGTRSNRKQRTFFLADVAPDDRRGSTDPAEWHTYYHAYPNDVGGVALQYWRFYAYNTGVRVLGIEVGFHGGDWEGMHLVLGADNLPVRLRLLGHREIEELTPDATNWEDTHPVVYAERGGHTTRNEGDRNGIRWETWSHPHPGTVLWPGQSPVPGGRLINVGEKIRPLNEQHFIQYSGLWGSPGVLYESSGYWGPAFNETALREDGFITAWGAGAMDPNQTLDGVREFYPSATSR